MTEAAESAQALTMSDQLRKAIKQRGGHRSAVTKGFNKIEDLSNSTIPVKHRITDIQGLISSIRKEQIIIEEFDAMIEEIYLTEDDDGTDYNDELDKRMLYHSEITSNFLKAESYVDELNLSIKPQPKCDTSSQEHSHHNGKLPDITLPKFSGDVLEWAPFWDAFTSEVHSNKHINKVRKFTYLKAHLIGPTLDIIHNMRTTESNYDDAIQILMERYGSKTKAIYAHCEVIQSLPYVDDTKLLQSLYDKMETNFRALAALGLTFDEESAGTMFIVNHLRSKLSKEIREAVSKQIGTTNWNLENMREALKVLLEVTESESTTSKSRVKTDKIDDPRFHSTIMTINSTRACVFCNDTEHKAFYCTELQTQEERYNFVRKNNLCINCLSPKHAVKDCKSTFTCLTCNKRHHTSLHS